MVRYAEPGTVEWVESGGGPLVAVPETVLPFWTGADGEETASDYDRACEVDGLVGLLPPASGHRPDSSQQLVLADHTLAPLQQGDQHVERQLGEAEKKQFIERDWKRIKPTARGQRFLNELLELFLA